MSETGPVLALVPARSGSKSVPDKNLRPYGGKPLMAWSIEQALAAASVDRVIVSTDSEHYAAIAREHGAETPFLRPSRYARDESTDIEVFEHALDWLSRHEAWKPRILVHLRPTHPRRHVADIDRMVEILQAESSLDSVRSISPAPVPPWKMWTRDAGGLITPVSGFEGERYNQPRQSLPPAFLQNACIDVVRAAVIREQHSMTGRRIHGYVMQESLDIDTHADLEASLARSNGAGALAGRTFCFDIDGVIASLVPGNDYSRSAPRQEIIDALNRLYDAGCRIVLHTARGSMTGIDWSQTTREQMERWGVRYHELLFGKPAADYYVDDRGIGLAELMRLIALLDSDKS